MNTEISEAVQAANGGHNMKPLAIWSLWDMFTFPILDAMKSLDLLSVTGEALKRTAQNLISVTNLRDCVAAAKTLETTYDQLELPACKGFASDVYMELFNLATNAPNENQMIEISADKGAEILHSVRALKRSLLREASGRIAVGISKNMLGYYQATDPLFGLEVRNQFPTKIKYDLEEAGKCMALERSTAVVFHLMRIVETALETVASCLAVSPPKTKNWFEWLKAIRDERLARNTTSRTANNTAWAESDYFQDIWQRIDSIKDAQRNSTMHVEDVYTMEEAQEIFNLTKGFMKKVASRMDENGLPLA